MIPYIGWKIMQKMNRSFSVVLFSVLLLVGCAPVKDLQYQTNGEKLLRISKEIACNQEVLKLKTDSLWDGISKRLSTVLPKEMPKTDRENMIKLRNTALIAMFKVYPQLDTLTKAKVKQAGQIDEVIVANLQQIHQKMEENDSEVLTFLGEVEKKSPQSFEKWSKAFDEAKHFPCKK
jgi:hypothetical protein